MQGYWWSLVVHDQWTQTEFSAPKRNALCEEDIWLFDIYGTPPFYAGWLWVVLLFLHYHFFVDPRNISNLLIHLFLQLYECPDPSEVTQRYIDISINTNVILLYGLYFLVICTIKLHGLIGVLLYQNHRNFAVAVLIFSQTCQFHCTCFPHSI